VRAARSGDSTPIIVSIPKAVVDVMKIKKGDKLRIYTDGEKIYLDVFEKPEI
jgi:bifunctional DNA-binding transcriptional regulator/antitoxin component of YhaV-PrlF toxin-antitoxin module